jgi:hypothetical protein
VKIELTVAAMAGNYITEIFPRHDSRRDLTMFLPLNSKRLTLPDAYNLRIPEQIKSVGLM